MKYTKEQVQDILTMSVKDAVEKYKVSPQTISAWRKKYQLDKAKEPLPLKTTCSNCEAVREHFNTVRETIEHELSLFKRLVKHYMKKDEE